MRVRLAQKNIRAQSNKEQKEEYRIKWANGREHSILVHILSKKAREVMNWTVGEKKIFPLIPMNNTQGKFVNWSVEREQKVPTHIRTTKTKAVYFTHVCPNPKN